MGNSSYQKIVLRSNVANNHPNTTSEPIQKTSPSQQISRVLMSCLFNYDGASQTFSPAAILPCFHQRWRPLGFVQPRVFFFSVYSFRSLSLLGHPNPLLIFCASVKATHRCSSRLPPLPQVPISLFKSHSVISPEAPARLSSNHGRDTFSCSDVVQQQKTVYFHLISLLPWKSHWDERALLEWSGVVC